MERTIAVAGVGTVTAEPDTVRFSGELYGETGSYEDAVARSAGAVADLRGVLEDAGFPGDGLRTTSFSVGPVYASEERDGLRVQVLRGYAYRHSIFMDIPSDNAGIGRLMGALASADDAPEFRMSYHVSDPSPCLSEARRLAVADARAKAEELASAAGVSIGEVVSIEYGQGADVPQPRNRMVAMAAVPDMVPRSEAFSDSVTVTWRIV